MEILGTEQNLSSSESAQAGLHSPENLYWLGKVLYDKADLQGAKEFFQKALDLKLPQEVSLKLKIYGFLVRIFSECLDQEKAQQYLEESQKLIDSSFDGSSDAEFTFQVGMVKTYQKKNSEARELLLKAWAKSKEEQNVQVLEKVLYALATNHFNVQELDQSEKYLRELNDLLQRVEKPYLQGNMHILYGNIQSERGHYELALQHYRWAVRILKKKNCWNLYGYCLLYQGLVYKKIEKFGESLACFEQARDLVDEENFKRLSNLIKEQVRDINDVSVDIHLDRYNRTIHEKDLGTIDFKHRFILLEILFLLARHPGTYFDKESLARKIWQNDYNPLIHDKLIYTSVSRLRQLLESKGEKRKYILRGKDGYTFNPHVKARFYNEWDGQTHHYSGHIDLGSPV